jgi:hypothetical protein
MRLVLIAAFLIGVLLLGGGAMVVLATLFGPPGPPASKPLTDSQWQLFRPEGGGCSVQMPGSPSWVLNVPGGIKHWLILKEEHYQFALFCGHPAAGLGAEDMKKLLEVDCAIELRTLPKSHISREEDISLDGFAGREVEIQGDGGLGCLIRVYLVRQGPSQRLYKLLVGGPGIRAGSAIASRFFDSFHLEDAQPPAAAKKARAGDPR